MKKIILLISIVFLLTGCFSKETSDSLKAGFDTQTEMTTSTPIVKGNNNNVTIHGETPNTKKDIHAISSADMESTYSSAFKISAGLNIFLFGVGAYLLYTIAKKSKVMRLTGGILDTIGASAIAMATNATDTKDIASANHLRAEIESARRHL